MKKIGDIMAEMGFKEEAPNSVKEAFIKHLIKSSTGVDVETPTEKEQRLNSEIPTQLAFNMDGASPSSKKAV